MVRFSTSLGIKKIEVVIEISPPKTSRMTNATLLNITICSRAEKAGRRDPLRLDPLGDDLGAAALHQVLDGAGLHHAAVVEDGDAVADQLDVGELVAAEEDRLALVAQRFDEVADLDVGHGIEA